MAFPDPDSYYSIQARHSGKVFDVRNSSWEPGTPVVQFGLGGIGKRNQQFLVHEGSKSGLYRLIAAHSELSLRIDKRSPDDGAALVQVGPDDAPMDFELRPAGSPGTYHIVAAHSGKALTVRDESKDDGAAIVQMPLSAKPAATFAFIHEEPRPATGSITVHFHSFRPCEPPENVADDVIVQVWFSWLLNGVKQDSYRELVVAQKTAFEIPRGATRIGVETKWSTAYFAKDFGTYRKHCEVILRVSDCDPHFNVEIIERT